MPEQTGLQVDFTRHYTAVMRTLNSHGLLLGSYDAAMRANFMTIGWGSLGWIWGQAVWTILVRPTRHSYRCIEHSGCFTINVPGPDLSGACLLFGTSSGADLDLAGITAVKAATVLAPAVTECPIVYECQVIHRCDVVPEKLADEILSGLYVDGDFHRMYYGKILAVRADADAAQRLR